MGLLKRLGTGASLLTLATVMGIVTGIALFSWLASQRNEVSASTETRSIVVAKQDVPAGAAISDSLLELRRVNVRDALPGAATDVKAVVGRLTRYPFTSGEQVIESKLVPKDTPKGNGLAFVVPAGLRAVSVAIDEVSSAGGLMVPGDRVDVMVSSPYTTLFPPTAKPADATNTNASVVTTMLQDVMVLAVGQESTAPASTSTDSIAARRDDIQAQPKARSVTLAVTPQQAQSLFLASQAGKVGLALRPFGDQTGQTMNPALAIEPGVPQRTTQTTSR